MRGGKFQFSTINTFGNTIGCSLAKENESKRKTRNTQKKWQPRKQSQTTTKKLKIFHYKKQNKNKQIRTSEIILMWEVDEIEEEV